MPLPEDESEWKNLMVIFATAKGNVKKDEGKKDDNVVDADFEEVKEEDKEKSA